MVVAQTKITIINQPASWKAAAMDLVLVIQYRRPTDFVVFRC